MILKIYKSVGRKSIDMATLLERKQDISPSINYFMIVQFGHDRLKKDL